MLSILNVKSTDNAHINCEDSVYVHEDTDYVYGIVADGCGSGIKSHFASQTFAYFIESQQYADITSNDLLTIMLEFLRRLKVMFHFSQMNLLSTAILFSYQKKSKILRIRCIGDGVYYVNDIEKIVDQNNTPDYLAYHLDDTEWEFEHFLNKYPEDIYYDVERFMICSDGIQKIQRSNLIPTAEVNSNVLFYPPTSSNYLVRMMNKLRRDHYTLGDDLTIVSYVRDDQNNNP